MKGHFNSENTFKKALKSLLDNGMLVRSGVGTTERKGGKRPYLYAITWLNVDEYKGKGSMHLTPNKGPIRTDWRPA
ncbi:hypothetical protein JCM19233_1801 [Vibrio astriarenae]|nr:hypothetical protein JCM19233_1801 [Vibrio sp. C7]